VRFALSGAAARSQDCFMQTALPILTPGRARHSRRPVLALVLAALVLAAAGAVIAVGVIRGGAAHQQVALSDGPFGIGQDIPVSFGALGVESVQRINGLTAKQLSSSTHGIAHLIKPGEVRVQTSITLTNLLDKPVAYSPSQFRLIAGKSKPRAPFSSSISPGTLQPSASIDAIVSFVVPANGDKLRMAFYDRGRKAPVLIDLGRVGKTTPDSAFDRFHRH
jgi:hypothetical protein